MAGDKNKERERRSYFRVDDIIPVVATPVHTINEKDREKIRTAACSRAFPMIDVSGAPEEGGSQQTPGSPDSGRLYDMMKEIKTRLDFLINHLMLEREGLSSTEKRPVNISACGIKLTITQPVKEKDIIELKLLLPTYPPVAVFAYGEVKRVTALDDQTYEVALEYINMGESVRNEFIQYTLNHQRDTIRRLRESGRNE
ncbi:MAG: hypothetical protein HZA16_14270 [Nitrospirae bacterium]|nr:hypothetical protein [Nitrospirota bacterium]